MVRRMSTAMSHIGDTFQSQINTQDFQRQMSVATGHPLQKKRLQFRQHPAQQTATRSNNSAKKRPTGSVQSKGSKKESQKNMSKKRNQYVNAKHGRPYARGEESEKSNSDLSITKKKSPNRKDRTPRNLNTKTPQAFSQQLEDMQLNK